MIIIAREDPVVLEVTTTVREWHKIWISLYLDHQVGLFDKIGSLIIDLLDLREELIKALKCTPQQDASIEQQLIALKKDIVNKLDLGNRLLNLDLVPRDVNFKPVSPIDLSPVKLYRLHSDAALQIPSEDIQGCQESINSTCGSILSTSSQTSSDSNPPCGSYNSYHLQLSLRCHYLVSLPPDELIEIFFSVVDATGGNHLNASIKPLTERFLVQIKNDEVVCGVPNTIFADIGSPNGRDLCLHIQVYRVGKMTLMDGHKTTFSKQTSGLNQSQGSQEGSNVSIPNAKRYGPNGLSKHRHSIVGLFNQSTNYRRPFGAAIISLKDHIRGTGFKETLVSLRVPSLSECEFSNLNELYSKKNQTAKPNPNLSNVQFDLALKYVSCPQESLPKLLIANPSCITEKRGFPDIVMPGDYKNDLFLCLESAEFEKGGKSIPKNIEASISLINKLGFPIEDCISPGSNCDNVSSYRSCVYYHSNSPKWNESIKINVPLSEFDGAHIRIEFRHCSTKEKEKRFLGFAFLPLSDQDGVATADKSHELYLYKCDPTLWEDENMNLCKYASLPHGPEVSHLSNKSNISQNFNHSSREVVTVSTFLLSTKLTQNSNLLNLLKWRELIKRNNKDFEDALKKVLVLKGEEIVKFLQDILDTLFDTFALYSNSGDDYSALIFKVLVHIFLLLDEPKYQNFRPVLDTYASNHFSATLVYRGLLACVKKCLEYSSIVERHVPIQRCFKSIKYVFQFIVRSKILYSEATGEINDEAFLNDLRHLFKLFELLLSNSNTKIMPIQVTFLESFPGAITQLSKVVSAHELARVVMSLIGSVGFTALPEPLSRAKLIFIKEAATSELIKSQEVRLMITENFCRHLEFYIKQSDELDLCYEVLEILIVKIHDFHWPSIYRLYQLTSKSNSQTDQYDHVMTVGEINAFSSSLSGQLVVSQLDIALTSISRELEPFKNMLDSLLYLLDQLIKDLNTDRIIVQKYCTVLLTILKLMSKASFDQFMRRRQIDFLKLCHLFRSLRAVYNRDWSVMQLTSHAILENPINEISKEICVHDDSLPINRHLSSYLKLIVDFITHPTLQIEVFSDRKKDYILDVFGDLRLKFCKQLLNFWTGLKITNICDLIPTSIQSLIDASLLPNNELQRRLIPIFWDMINAEEHCKFSSRQFERCFIDNLDLFINLDRSASKFAENFESIMKQLLLERSPTWEQKGTKLIASLTKLMHLLIDYRQSLESPENRSKQMVCLVDLLNFYSEQDRTDLHLRYLFKLSDMHLEVGNHTEAAFTLKLYTDEIRWCNRAQVPLDGYRPEEQEWHRKEVLYQKIVHYFDLGKCWEESIALCKELASFYENFLVDYEKLSSTLKKLAQFLDCILTEHRPEREYFRVEFLGKDMPDFIRGKAFVYRGGEYERRAAFMQRMSYEFPDAQILNSVSKESITKDSLGQFMIITNVKPIPLLQDHFKSSQRNINDKIMHYYLHNRVDTFSYDTPIVRNPSSGVKEKSNGENVNVKNLWVGRHVMKTKRNLPDILPWSEVVSQEYMEITPINHAIETISAMNYELTKLILSYKTESNKQISPLTMRLQGVIEAAVNGGPSVFINAFLKRQPDEPENHYEPDLLNKLRELLKQQFSLLDTGLTLHSKLAPPTVMPLHDRLVERLQSIRNSC